MKILYICYIFMQPMKKLGDLYDNSCNYQRFDREKKTYNKCTLNKYNNQAQNMQSFVL